MSLHSWFCFFCVAALGTTPVIALEIRSYNSSRHDRFLNFPGNPSLNPSFVHSGVDLAGVGWHTGYVARQLTMVSPKHFVGANHFKPGIGASIRFLNTSGSLKTYQVNSQSTITNDAGDDSDLFIGAFAQPIPPSDGIGYHPYLNLANDAAYTGKTVLFMGSNATQPHSSRGTVETLASVVTPAIVPDGTNPTRSLTINYNRFAGGGDDAYVVSGDSGSPIFINQGGVAAIVGVNSFLQTNPASYVTYASFVPHYADKLNAVMEADGYRMTKAIPGSTTLVLDHQVQAGVVRAGYPFTIDLTVSNTGGTLAENLRLNNSFPNGTTVGSATGTGWFDESTATDTKARKAKLESASATTYSVSLTIPEAGTAQHQVTFSCDQFSVTTETFNIEAVGSFLSFASGLADPSETGDDDLDGIINLLEYVFGGDPRSNSRFLPASTTHLLPVIGKDNGAFSISYIRRTDHVQRAITYALETSGTMGSGTWTDATPFITGTTVSPINAGLEKVTHGLSGVTTSRFFRVKVDVDE